MRSNFTSFLVGSALGFASAVWMANRNETQTQDGNNQPVNPTPDQVNQGLNEATLDEMKQVILNEVEEHRQSTT